MELGCKIKVRGFFKLIATDANGKERLLADWFPNLITNGGLDQLGGAATWLTGCSVGSGNTAPADTDTQLSSIVASSSNIIGTASSVLAVSPYYGSRINTYFFAAGAATGVLAELGLGLSPTALFSRALILNSMGAPTTVTVAGGESLTVFYEFRNYPPLTDTTGTVVIGGLSYNYIARAANVGGSNWAPSKLGDIGGGALTTAFAGAIAAITGGPTGTNQAEDSGADVAYTPGSLHVDRNSVWGGASANFGGINSLLFLAGQINASLGQFQVGFNTPIPKDNTHSLTLTVRQFWARGPV